MEDINQLLDKIISDNSFTKILNDNVEKDSEYIEKNYNGVNNAKKLFQVAKIYKKKSSFVMSQIFAFSDRASITDEIFKYIVKLPKRKRNTLLVALSHCDLSFYQLNYICHLNICTEAFNQIFNMILKYDCFSSLDLLHFLESNKINKIFIKNIIKCVIGKNELDEDKLEVLNSLM